MAQTGKGGGMKRFARIVLAGAMWGCLLSAGCAGGDAGYVPEHRQFTGLIDRTGKATEVTKDVSIFYARAFSEGLAGVLVGEKWGYVDASGRLAVVPRFLAGNDFHEGLAAVVVEGGRSDWPHSRGMAFRGEGSVWMDVHAGLHASRWGYVDKTGRISISAGFHWAGDFHEGLAAASRLGEETELGIRGKPSGVGFIDRNGLWVIEPSFAEAGEFSEELAAVVPSGGDGKGKWGYIDKAGRWVIPARFARAGRFREGLAAVEVEGEEARGTQVGCVGYVNRTGRLVIPPNYRHGGEFSEGLACVRTAEGYRYINTKGEFAMEGRYQYAQDFSEGLAAVCVAGKWGYIDTKGRWVITPRFTGAGAFREGIARVAVTNQPCEPYGDGGSPMSYVLYGVPGIGFITKSGAFFMRPAAYLASDFNGDRAWVDLDRPPSEAVVPGTASAPSSR